jgi:hypothetical protein
MPRASDASSLASLSSRTTRNRSDRIPLSESSASSSFYRNGGPLTNPIRVQNAVPRGAFATIGSNVNYVKSAPRPWADHLVYFSIPVTARIVTVLFPLYVVQFFHLAGGVYGRCVRLIFSHIVFRCRNIALVNCFKNFRINMGFHVHYIHLQPTFSDVALYVKITRPTEHRPQRIREAAALLRIAKRIYQIPTSFGFDSISFSELSPTPSLKTTSTLSFSPIFTAGLPLTIIKSACFPAAIKPIVAHESLRIRKCRRDACAPRCLGRETLRRRSWLS